MVTEKTWAEFRETGLFLFLNHFLHIFGWAIVLEMDGDTVKRVYPARVKFRGFEEVHESKAYHQVAKFMKDNAAELEEEAR